MQGTRCKDSGQKVAHVRFFDIDPVDSSHVVVGGHYTCSITKKLVTTYCRDVLRSVHKEKISAYYPCLVVVLYFHFLSFLCQLVRHKVRYLSTWRPTRQLSTVHWFCAGCFQAFSNQDTSFNTRINAVRCVRRFLVSL